MLVAFEQQRLDPLVFAVGGQVGADVERLAAAGRDRHDAAQDDDVADRPGHDRQQQSATSEQRRAGEARAPAALRARPGPAARTTKAAATARYSGRTIAVRPKRKPGTSQARRRSRSPAQRKASTAAGRVRIAGGSLISSPVEWMKGG